MITQIKYSAVKWSLLVVFALLFALSSAACSGYKVTVGGKTVVGINEDAWRLTPHIWFETAKGNQKYGAAFTGSRQDGKGYAPQAGMNEVGLAFERLASYHPMQEKLPHGLPITHPSQYLKDILHTCKTVEEVRDYISQYDYSYFIEDVFMYVDQSGKYLIVEPYTLTIGSEATYVVSNFCPSITSEEKASQLARYRNGVDFLKKDSDSTLAFFTALSDTMHVCREKIGDGTLLSSIWDLENGTVHLYFYHDFSQSVKFQLFEELKKGDHLIAIDTLFPRNAEFEALRHFKTPKNSRPIGLFIVSAAVFFLFTSLFFLVKFFRRKKQEKFAWVPLALVALNGILFYYMVVLSGSINKFYFPAPYKDPGSIAVTLSSYIPFLLLILIVPFLLLNYRIVKEKSWSMLSQVLITLHALVQIMLIGLFVYWEFYDVF